ncbi:MAG: hypothetical protein GX162_01825 [Firmicutes bacterium]|nr:hypothetical protein [Bacillota bacterium]
MGEIANPTVVNNLLAAIPFFKRHEIDEIDRPPLPTCIYTTAIVDSEHVKELRLGFVQNMF